VSAAIDMRAPSARPIVPRPRTRERVPTDVAPNFRDHCMTVDRALLNLIASLQRKNGQAFASEAGLRHMIREDVRHMPGVGTIPAALKRLEEQGVIAQEWLCAGQILPDGQVCTHGTRLVWLPMDSRSQRALMHRAKTRNRREPLRNRVVPHAAKTLSKAIRSIEARLEVSGAAPDRDEAYWRSVEASRTAAAEWMRREDDQKSRAPP